LFARSFRRLLGLFSGDLLGQFLSHDGILGRRLDANANASRACLDDSHRDLIPDQNPFSNASGKH